jgi:oligopeptidase B
MYLKYPSWAWLVISLTFLMIACSPAPQESSSETPKIENAAMAKQFPRIQMPEVEVPRVIARAAEFSHHGITVDDPFQWLRDADYPEVNDTEVLEYLNAENDYYNAFLSSNTSLVDTIFNEMKGRIEEDKTSVPFVSNGYEYRWEYRSGNEYRSWIRKNLSTGEENIFIDESALSKGHDYFALRGWDISPDNQLVVYTIDTTGDERFTAVVKDITTDAVLPIDLTNIRASVNFTPDGQGIIYSKLFADRWMVESINLRWLNADSSGATDKIIFTEDDPEYFIGAYFTSDDNWLVKVSERGSNTEIQVLPADDLLGQPLTLVSKQDNFAASLDAAHGKLYLLANDTHVNFRLLAIDTNKLGEDMGDKSKWDTLISGNHQNYMMRLQAFNDFIALTLRSDGQDSIQILNLDGTVRQEIEFPESVFSADLTLNREFSSDTLRLYYESMITPPTIFDYQLQSNILITRKVEKIPSGYNKSDYITERLMAPSRDGVQIPISIVYHKSLIKDGKAPLSMTAYGAYAQAERPNFDSDRLSLLDRGFAFALAHVRGGDEMGYQWYLDGKLEKRENTFNDLIDVSHFLISEGYTSKGNISIAGGSAGGQLMGAMVIQAPQLWRSVILSVPFVDVLNTMLDASLPLTPPEWHEWGNPIEDKQAFEYILSYSPYDQIIAREYPPMMVTGGLNDPRVTYWEPAKWTARMRATKTDQNLLVMRINMGAGHFANSGRYARIRDYAEEYVFQLLAHGITE